MIGAVKTMAIKEFRQFRRDRQFLVAVIIMPIFLLLMFGYAISLDVKTIQLAVCNMDGSATSREFLARFVNSTYFVVRDYVARTADIDTLLETEECKAGFVIPSDFSKKIERGEPVSFQVLVDGSNAQVASTIVGYINAVSDSYSRSISPVIKSRQAAAEGNDDTSMSAEASLPIPVSGRLPVDPVFRIWFNPELKSARFLVPGLIAMIMAASSVLSTALSIVREKERGTMEQLLVSPVSPFQVIIGKTVPYVVLAVITASFVLFAAYVFFGIVIKGNFFLLGICTFIFLSGVLGMGIMLSTIAETQQVAFMLSTFTTLLPSYILSGFIFPLRNMPIVLQLFSYLVPARYFIVILRTIIIKGSGLSAIWPELLGITIFAGTMLTLGIVRLRRQMTI
jgi:ABC-2 type transport system permease protein